MSQVQELIKSNSIPDQESGCWVWQGPFNQQIDSSRKYGKLRKKIEGSNEDYAHRFSYEAFKGEIVSGLYVCHKCDNRIFVNPDHLFLGTQKQNLRDMHDKGRAVTRKKKAERLSDEQALSIRADSRIHRIIAEEYGLTRHEVRGIKTGSLFPHLKDSFVIRGNYGLGLSKPRKKSNV